MKKENENATERKRPKEGVKEVKGRLVGRDKKVIPPDEVFKLAQLGCKDIEIGDWFGCDTNSLRYNFSVELLKGRESLKQSLRRAMIANALKGNAAVQIFLAKNYLSMSDNPLNTEDNHPLPWSDEL